MTIKVADAWRAGQASELRWQCWGAECCIYHIQSGETHLLNPLGAALLRLLDARPQCLAELQARLIETHQDDQRRARAALLGLLRRFEELGLAQRATAWEPEP